MKKRIKRTLLKAVGAALALCIALPALTSVSLADDYTDSGISYTDSAETLTHNPGRGHSVHSWHTLEADGDLVSIVAGDDLSFTVSGMGSPMFSLSEFSSGNNYVSADTEQYVNVRDRPELVGGENIEITDEALAAIRAVFQTARERGVVLAPRFAYAPSFSEGGKGYGIVGAEPDDLRWVLKHIEQLCRLINEYRDVIVAVECGMLGPWGEMHTTPYTKEQADVQAFMNCWFDNLDGEISILIRNTAIISTYYKTTAAKMLNMLPFGEDEPFFRVGFYNDGYLGSGEDCYTWAKPTEIQFERIWRENGISMLSHMGERHPYGGELAYVTVDALRNGTTYATASPIYGAGIVKELYDTHLSYLHNINDNHNVIKELKTLPLTEEHDFEGMPDLTEYYGTDLHKFMNDHMGYRYVLREAKASREVKAGDTVTLTGKVENTGFSKMMVPTASELVIVDGNGNAEYIPLTLDAQEWESASLNSYKFTVSVPGNAAGEYKAYLRIALRSYMESKEGSCAVRFANPDVYEQTCEANYIGSFTVTGSAGRASRWEQINVSAFSDVSASKWYADAIDYVTSAAGGNVMNGVGDGLFSPDGTTTRGQLVTVLYNFDGKPAVSAAAPFTDVASGRYYTAPIAWAYENGIVNGVTDTTFHPDGNITREQFAAILYRYSAYKKYDTAAGADLSVFPDAGDASSYARTALSWANAEGLITGTYAGGQTLLDPKGNATRAQMAQIMTRYIKGL